MKITDEMRRDALVRALNRPGRLRITPGQAKHIAKGGRHEALQPPA